MKRSLFSMIMVLSAASAAQAGAFKEACMANAESTLNASELAAITARALDKKADYVAAINAMTEAQAAAFHDKMRVLSDAVDEKCPAFAQ